MYNNDYFDLDESLQANFEKDFEKEFGPFNEWSGELTSQEFFNHNKKIVDFCDKWRISHGL